MRPSALATALVPLILLGSGGTSAAIFKCVDADGAVTYSGLPCSDEDFDALVIEPSVRPMPPAAERNGRRTDEPARTGAAVQAGAERIGEPGAEQARERGRGTFDPFG